MNILLYYLDKFTSWLDFSWLITKPKAAVVAAPPPVYINRVNNDYNSIHEPLLRM